MEDYASQPLEDLVLITVHDLDYAEETEITLGRKDTVKMLKEVYSAHRNFGSFSAYKFSLNGRAPTEDETFENMDSDGPYFFLARLTPEAVEKTKIAVTVVNGHGKDPSPEVLYPTKMFRSFKVKFCKKKNRVLSYYVFFLDGMEILDSDTGHSLGIGEGSIIMARASTGVSKICEAS